MSQTLTPKRKLYSVSPSQVTSYRQCPRLWFWSSILNDRGTSSRANVLGDAVHKALEHYMETGEVWPTVTLPAPYLAPEKVTAWIEPGHVPAETFETLAFVQAAIDHLPPTSIDPYWKTLPEGHGIMVEQQGEMATYEGGPSWNQYIDLVVAQPGEVGEIDDYKTRSNFRYNKTPAELSHDVQLTANAKWLFLSSDYKTARLKHFNLLTRGRTKCVPVEVTVTREEVEAEWQKTLVTVREMEQWAAIASEADKLPPNTESCDMYGGCRKKSACGFDTKLVTLRSLGTMSTAGSNLLNSLLAGKGVPAPVAAAPAAPAAPPPVVGVVVPAQGTAPAPFSAVGGLLGSLLVPKAPAAAPAPVAPAPTPQAAVVSSLSALLNPAKAAEPLPVVVPPSAYQAAAVAAGYPVDFKPTGSISPPDAPPRTSTPEQVAAANAPSEPETNEEDEETGTVPTGVPTAEATSGAPAKRKRRTKAEMEAARAAGVTAAAIEQKIVTDVVAGFASAMPSLTGLLAQVNQTVLPEAMVLASTGAYTQEVTEEFSQAQYAAPSATDNLVSAAQTLPAPVDPITAQIKHRLNTPDVTNACPVRFVFIDCMPAKGWPVEDAPIDAREVWHAITGNASAAAKVADYRFIKYESKAYLSASVRAMLRGLPTCLYVDSSIPDIQELLTAVIPYASLVVHGR